MIAKQFLVQRTSLCTVYAMLAIRLTSCVVQSEMARSEAG